MDINFIESIFRNYSEYSYRRSFERRYKFGARWDLELLFKELKSKYALDVLDTKNEQVIEALIWTAMLTLIVSRRIYSLVNSNTAHPGKMVRYTQLRWRTIFAENASDLLTLILHNCGIERTFETVMSVYDSQALDPHVIEKGLGANGLNK